METKMLLARCRKNGRAFGIRVEKTESDWLRTRTFKMSEARVKKEGHGKAIISGVFDKSQDYPGCPHCKKEEFFTCPDCGKLTCTVWGEPLGICKWCDCELPDLVWDRVETELQSTVEQ